MHAVYCTGYISNSLIIHEQISEFSKLTLIRHMIEVGYPRTHAKNHIPSLLLDEKRFSSNN